MGKEVDVRLHSFFSPLIISGGIKSGKTFTAEVLIPHLASKHWVLGLCGSRQVSVVKLTLAGVLGQAASQREILECLLRLVMESWQEANLRAPEDDWQWACAALNVSRDLEPELAVMRLKMGIEGLLTSLEQPTLIILDEVQAFVLPKDGQGRLDEKAARDQWVFLKHILYFVSSFALWVLTGSCLASFWWAVSKMPPNAVALLTGHFRLDLQPAREGWLPALSTFSQQQRQAMHALSSLELGIPQGQLELPTWIRVAFSGQLMPTHPGSTNRVLRSFLDRHCLQRLVAPDGSLLDEGPPLALSMAYEEVCTQLVKLSDSIIERDGGQMTWQQAELLDKELQELALLLQQRIGDAIHPSIWPWLEWFKAVLLSPHNQSKLLGTQGTAELFQHRWQSDREKKPNERKLGSVDYLNASAAKYAA
ncbi:hypothetical protein WJX73_003647 [Symbiochloris irregularis]|uniref:ATP-binding protein n=1 Tax=Symbiochloris irregularis TaxID=706552 RepID=A0AAW1PRU0_9CHLO